MPILSFNGRKPSVAGDCFVSETSTIVGDVAIGSKSSVWFGASIRAEKASVTIGERSNVQDNCVIHVDEGFPCEIGDGVTLGHGAIVHGARIGSNCLVGMGAILLNGSSIGNNCLVAAGSLVPQGVEMPDDSLVIGSPAKARRKLTEDEIRSIGVNASNYAQFASDYLAMKKSA